MTNHAHRKPNPFRVPGCAVYSRNARRYHDSLTNRLGRKCQIADLRRGYATGGIVTMPFPRADWSLAATATPLADIKAVSAFARALSVPLLAYSEQIATEIAAKYAEMRANIVNNEPIAPNSGSIFGKMASIERLKEDIASGKVVFQKPSFPPYAEDWPKTTLEILDSQGNSTGMTVRAMTPEERDALDRDHH